MTILQNPSYFPEYSHGLLKSADNEPQPVSYTAPSETSPPVGKEGPLQGCWDVALRSLLVTRGSLTANTDSSLGNV